MVLRGIFYLGLNLRWFKHMTDSLDDPFIQELLDNFNHQGYMAFFGLIEIIGKENKDEITGKLKIQPIFLKRKLRISQSKLEDIYNFCARKGKLFFEKTEGNVTQNPKFSKVFWEFHFPKIVDIKDNYSGYGSGFKGLTRTIRERIKERDNGTCRYCNKPCEFSDLVIDHIIPFSQGGKTEDDNLVVACRSCNSRKRDRTPGEAGMTIFEVASNKPSNHKEVRVKKQIKKKTTPLTPHGGDGQWEKFWTAYPKRKSKQDAIKAWNQLEPDDGLLQIMLAAIQTQRETEQWQKESGEFIPFPATWIRGRLWEDETGEIIGEDDNEQKWENGRYLPSKRMLREQREG